MSQHNHQPHDTTDDGTPIPWHAFVAEVIG